MNKFIVVVLAGGSSSRFKPLSEKNLYKFMGKTVVEWQLERLETLQADKLVVITNENNKELIGEEVNKIKTNAKVIVQKGQGQAGAVRTALEEIPGSSELLIVNMNDLFDESLLKKFNVYRAKLFSNHSCALTGFKTEKYFPGGYLKLNKDNTIAEVIEKPGEGNEPSDFVRIVFDYFYNSEKLIEVLNKVDSGKDDLYEVALTRMIKEGEDFEMLPYEGEWKSIKYAWHILEAMEHFLNNISEQKISAKAQVSDAAIVNGNVVIEKNVKVFPGAVINGPAYIGENTIIGNNALVRDSIVGKNCVVGYNSEVARSYLLEEVWLHMNYIGDSIVERNVSFGSTAVTANLRLDEKNVNATVKGERLDTGLSKLGAIIASNVRVGVGAKIMPGVVIGSNSVVGPGVILSDDLEENTFIKVSQDHIIKENQLDISAINRDEAKKKLSK